MENLNLVIEFGGGAELLFNKVKKHSVQLPGSSKPWTLRKLLVWLKENLLTERPELFVQGETVFLSTMDLENINNEEILLELYDSSSDKEEEDNIEYEVEEEEAEYDSDADPEYIPDVEELCAVDELLVEDIREIEECKSKKKKNSNENKDSRNKRKGNNIGNKSTKKPKINTNSKEEIIQNAKEKEFPTIIVIGDESLVGKDNKFVWDTKSPNSSNGKTPAKDIVHIRSGPTQRANNFFTPRNCFKLFFTENIMEEILTCTNKEIAFQRESYANKNHLALSNLDMEELEAFLGLLVLSAALKDNHLTTTLMFNTSYCGERYKATTTERRFKFLLTCLRFDDKETRDARKVKNKLAPISNIWDMLLKNCRENYKPGSYLTIDEQLVGFRGRCPFRMYIPSKPNKYGIKIVMCCDSGTKYMVDAKPYLGKGTYPSNIAAGTFFVEELIQTVKGSNRNLTIDNWFTSIPLVQRLRNEYKLTTVGTIKKNKPELPVQAVDKNYDNRKAPTSLFLFHKDVTVVSYKPNKKKLVVLVSSMHDAATIDDTTKKPDIVSVYNSTKGGVDSFDQMCQNMNHGRKTKRWPLCFFTT